MSVPTCVITGHIKGHPSACGDCDPCILGIVPEPVKRLLAECSEWAGRYEAEAIARDEARAEAERLRAALKPFAAVAEHDIGEDEVDADMFRPMRRENARAPILTVGDLRAARAALTPTDPEGDQP